MLCKNKPSRQTKNQKNDKFNEEYIVKIHFVTTVKYFI